MNPLLIGALFGGIRGLDDDATDRAQKAAQQKYGATAIRMSPWSGVNADTFANKDYRSKPMLSSLLQGAEAGVNTAADINNLAVRSEVASKWADHLNSKKAPTDEWSGFTPDKNALAAYTPAVTKAKSPYSGLYTSELGVEPEGKDNIIDLLKGQARRSFGNA